jgi:hypothetical protein
MSAIQSTNEKDEGRMLVLSRVASTLLEEVKCANPFQVLMSSGTETYSEASGAETPAASDSEYNTAEELVEPDAYDADAESDATNG